MIPVKKNLGSRLTSTPLAVKNNFYPKTLETLTRQRDPQEWRGSLMRLSSSDMADNQTTIEDTAKNIKWKENLSSLRRNWQEVYFAANFGASSGKMYSREDQKE